MKDINLLIKELSPEKRNLFELRRGHRQALILKPIGRMVNLPLSFAQQRLWFLDQLEPGSAVYNMPQAIRLEGAVEIEGLQWALSEIMRRHEVLRTTFPVEGGQARQRIEPAKSMELPLIDIRAGGEDLARQMVEQEAIRPFDLERGPIWRATLLRLGEEDHVLMVTIHHIASDGWSMGLLVSEFNELYGAWREHRVPKLKELEIQYADFAVWQRGWLTGQVLERQLGYWKEQLKDLEPLELPTDRARPAVATHRGAVHTFTLNAELVAALRELSRRQDVTLFMTLLAAFNVLLARYSGQWDIAVGTDIANRNRVETEDLIGFFVNQLTLRVQMEPGWSFRQLLTRVREVTLEAYEHQDLPFEKLVEEIAPERNMSRSADSPLFQVKVVLQNAPQSKWNVRDLQMHRWEEWRQSAVLDLTASITECGDCLGVRFEYSTDLFEASTIKGVAEHYRQLLASVVRYPEQRLRDMEMVPREEQCRLLKEGKVCSCCAQETVCTSCFKGMLMISRM